MLTDLHHHLIFGVDDGAKDRTMSLEMLKLAAAQGVGGIVCTSHNWPGMRELDLDAYHRGLDELRAMAADEGIDMQLYPGSEVLFTPDTPQALQQGRIQPLGSSRCVLVEFFPDMPWQLMVNAVQEVDRAGYRTVLAHAERYQCLERLERLRTLKEEYQVLIQMNADTVLETGKLFAGRWAKDALKAGLIDAVASDAHSSGHRACHLGDAHRLLTRKYGSELADALCSRTPLALLQT